MVSWLTFGSEMWPQTRHSPIVTLLLLAASVFAVSSTKNHSAISQPRPALKPYHQFVHGLNSLLVWFQCRVWSADVTVRDNITPCPTGSKKGWIGGGYFHLLQALFSAPPWQKSIVRMHCLDLMLQRVRHRCHIGRCLCSSGEDVSATRQWCIVH